jgi:hypothetical protein
MIRRALTRAAGLFLAVGFLVALPAARAQVVVVTMKSAGEVLGDLRYLVSAVAPSEDQAKPILASLDQFGSPDFLKGLDRTRPIGAFADLPKEPNGPPTAVVFIPVSDAKDFLASLGGLGFIVEEGNDAPGFTHKVTPPGGNGPPLFALTQGGYTFLSLAPTGADALKALKPASLRPDRPGAGDITVSLRFDRLPDQYKDLFFAQFEQSLAAQREKQPGEDDIKFRGRISGMKLSQDAITGLVKEGKELALDVVIDRQKKDVAIELSLSARPGTESAATLRAFGSRSSLFSGMGRGSIIDGWLTLPIPESIRTLLSEAFDKARTDALAKVKNPDEARLTGRLLDTLKPTLTGDETDMGFSLLGPFPRTDGPPTMVALLGIKLKEGRKIETLLRDAAREVKPDEKVDVKFDMDKASDGTPIHRILAPATDDSTKKQFGTPYVYSAFRDDLLLIAVGEQGLKVLKDGLDSTKVARAAHLPQIAASMSFSKFGAIADAPDREKATAAARQAFKGPDAGKDALRLDLKAEGDSVKLRLSMDVPVLKFFALSAGQDVAKAPPNP